MEDGPADDAAPTAKEATETTSRTTAPLPADTIGKAKAVAADGKAKAVAADEAAADTPAVAAETAAAETAAVKSSPSPSFTPSVSKPSSAPSAPAASAATPAPARTAAAPTSRPGAGTSYVPPAPRPEESAGTPSSTPVQPGGSYSYSGGNGSSRGTASTVTGAAAGLASSVASVWQRRGSNGRPAAARGPQVRKPAKRQAMLTLARVEPWSVMKFSFVASVVAFIILFVAVAVLYMVLAALGVFDSLQHTVSSITGAQGTTGTDISHYYSASVVLGYTAMLGALNIVLITAMSTVGSVIYNLIAKTIGGIEVTLRETE